MSHFIKTVGFFLFLASFIHLKVFGGTQLPINIYRKFKLQVIEHSQELQTLKVHNSTLLSRCEEKFKTTVTDHYSYINHSDCGNTYQQRYFVCDNRWGQQAPSSYSPIFIYFGNEADIELFLENTGLMWENAEQFGALIVFAEHRYYGKSLPCVNRVDDYTKEKLRFLTAEQAMSDFTDLIFDLKKQYKLSYNSPVIGFGGSYGGMLATWMRQKYAHVVDGVIAGSAPIWVFPGVKDYDTYGFFKTVTRDYVVDGSITCKNNIQKLWKYLFKLGNSKEGLKVINDKFRICEDGQITNEEQVEALAGWLQEGFTAMGQGNYPFPSSYLTFGGKPMPAWPVSVACTHLQNDLENEQLLEGIIDAVGVFYNSSKSAKCYRLGALNNATAEVDNIWGYQVCTEQYIVIEANGVTDMFWPQQFDRQQYSDYCYDAYGIQPRPYAAYHEWGGKKIQSASNIIFSNGLYDPWSSAGVLQNISDTIISSIIPEGAHHLDLMFSNPQDPQSVKNTRRLELESIQKWINQARQHEFKEWAQNDLSFKIVNQEEV